MLTLVPLLVSLQALGALIGAFTTLWALVAYFRALGDGDISTAERKHLHAIGHGLYFGMLLLLLSSLGLVIVQYLLQTSTQPALTSSYWILVAFVLLIIGVSWALSRRHISFVLGSAVALAAWWILVYLTFGELPTHSFGATAALFVVVATIFAGVLYGGRLFVTAV